MHSYLSWLHIHNFFISTASNKILTFVNLTKYKSARKVHPMIQVIIQMDNSFFHLKYCEIQDLKYIFKM